MKLNLIISLLIFLICFLFQNSYSQQNVNGWYWINSQPQGNTLNWIQILDDTHYFAVGEYGTFMKSSDGGDTWLVNNQAGVEEPSFGSGSAYRLYSGWFFNSSTGYVVGQSLNDDGGIIKRTTDGGNTFTEINLGIGSGISRVKDIYFINSTTGFLCGTSVVKAFKTTDAGLSWEFMSNLPDGPLNYECVYAIDENNIILGAASNGGPGQRNIVRTTDGGATWNIETLPGTTSYTFNDITFQNANTGFIGGEPNYFGFTTNGGANWTQAIYPNINTGIKDLQIVGNKVYALSSYYSYYNTTNLGVTWDSVLFDDPSNVNQPTNPFIVNSFSIKGNDAIVVGYNGKINISNDDGASWRNKNYSVGNSQYSFASIYAQPGTGNVWSGAGYGGLILYSSNRGDTWTKQQTSATYAIYDIDMKTSTTGYAVGGDPFFGAIGYCFKTTNSGTNWTNLTIPDPGYARFKVDFINENTGWTFGGAYDVLSVISKTTNGGTTWVSQTLTPDNTSVVASGDMIDENTGYCLSGFTTPSPFIKLYKTTNGGSDWNLNTTFPSNQSWQVVQAFSASTLYLGGKQSIYKTTNSGLNWTTASIPSALANIFNMDWTDMNNGMVVGTQGYTAKTTDGGLTWTERNTGSSTITGVSMASKDTVYASCDRNVYGAIFRLYDYSNSISINLTAGIQGFWDGTSQVSDTVQCHLRNSVSPFAEVGVANAVLNTSGNATFLFNSTPSGSYYIEITHRNSLETWSKLPQTISVGNTYNYDFTSAATQAYGNNMVLKSGRYCDYSGDVTQEGSVDLTDIVQVYNSAAVFTTGYVVYDVNGDNTVDLTDIIITFNNASIFVTKQTP